MPDQPVKAPSRRGRPRSEKARVAILEAAGELLLARGLAAVSMDTLAERANVSKATIYRWWPTKEALALDAVYQDWAGVHVAAPDTGSLRADLLALLRPWVRLVSSRPYARLISALISHTHIDPKFAQDYRDRFVQPRRDAARAILVRAVARGELDASVPVEVALDLLYGSLYHRMLHGHAQLSETFVNQIVDLVLRGATNTRAGGDSPV